MFKEVTFGFNFMKMTFLTTTKSKVKFYESTSQFMPNTSRKEGLGIWWTETSEEFLIVKVNDFCACC